MHDIDCRISQDSRSLTNIQALRQHRESMSIPEFRLDFSGIAHLPKSLSSLDFPHRNADAYLRDSELDGQDFMKTKVGKEILGATAQACGPLVAWFPQALLYGFWQSHLGRKRQNTKHARTWVSEIVGWQPASTETKALGLKGDALSLSRDAEVTSNPDDRADWDVGKDDAIEGGRKDKLSEMGRGQVLFHGCGRPGSRGFLCAGDAVRHRVLRAASSRRSRHREPGSPGADAAARALLVVVPCLGTSMDRRRGQRDDCREQPRRRWRPFACSITYSNDTRRRGSDPAEDVPLSGAYDRVMELGRACIETLDREKSGTAAK